MVGCCNFVLVSHTSHEHEGLRSSHAVCFSFVVSVVGCSLSSIFFVFSAFVVSQPLFFTPVHGLTRDCSDLFFCSRKSFGLRSWLGKLGAGVRNSSFVVHTLVRCSSSMPEGRAAAYTKTGSLRCQPFFFHAERRTKHCVYDMRACKIGYSFQSVP